MVSTEWKDSDVRHAGATLERWRYKSSDETEGPLGARSNAVEQLLRYRSGAPMGTDLEPNPQFSDVSAKLVCESEWTCVSYVPLAGRADTYNVDAISFASCQDAFGEAEQPG